MTIKKENPSIFQKMNVAFTGMNEFENKKFDIGIISDNKQKSDDIYMNMKSNSVKDNFTELTSHTCPQSSIDLIFNKRNVWFNRQHFNPAVVKFDLFDPFKWSEVFDANQLNINEQQPPLSFNEPIHKDLVRDLEKSIQFQIKN